MVPAVPYKGSVQWAAQANIGRVVWSSSDTTVVEVADAGVVTGKKPGGAEVCARIDGLEVRACAHASVLPPEFVAVKFEYQPDVADNGISLEPIEGKNADGSYFVRHPDGRASIPNLFNGTYYTTEWQVKPGQNLTLRVGVFRGTGKFERWLRPDEMVLNGKRLQRASPVETAPPYCADWAECKEGAGAYFDIAYDNSVTP